jgi:glycosyltransferase involved in cell wall biosynthesis
MSKVNVVVPCHNYGKFLADCVAGALDDQPGVDSRVLIIDDASQDDSAEVAQKLAASDDRIDVIVHTANKGHIATFNEGLLDWADGDYCVLISADDKLTPGALRRAADVMDANPEVGFVYGGVVNFVDGEEMPPAKTVPSHAPKTWPGRQWLTQRFREAHAVCYSPEVIIRTSVQHKVGGYNPELYHTSDVEMWMRLAAVSDVGFVFADQAFKRTHGEMMSGVVDDLLHLQQRRKAYRSVLKIYGDVLPNTAELSALVHRELAKEALWHAARAYDQRQTDTVPVDDLVAFAFDCWPNAFGLSTYRALQWRRQVGATAAPYFRPLVWPRLLAREALQFARDTKDKLPS